MCTRHHNDMVEQAAQAASIPDYVRVYNEAIAAVPDGYDAARAVLAENRLSGRLPPEHDERVTAYVERAIAFDNLETVNPADATAVEAANEAYKAAYVYATSLGRRP